MPATPISRIANPQLTREQVLSVLVQPLMQRNVLLAAGPVIYESDGSQLRIPKLQGGGDTDLYAENELIADTEVDFDSIVMLPPTLKSVKVLCGFSNESLRSAVVALEAALRDRLTYMVSKKLDYLFFEGTGAVDAKGNVEPLGMLNWTAVDEVKRITITGAPTGGTFTLSYRGETTAAIAYNATPANVRDALRALSNIGATDLTSAGTSLPGGAVDITFNGLPGLQPGLHPDASGLTGGTAPTLVVTTTTPGVQGAQTIDLASATPTLDTLHDMLGMALAEFAEPNRWFMTPRVLTFIRKLKDEYGRFQLQPDPKVENGFTLLGLPVSVTNHLAPGAPKTGDSTIALCDMSQIAIGRDMEPSVRVLDQLRGDRDQTVIRVVARYDIAPRNAQGVVLANNVDHAA